MALVWCLRLLELLEFFVACCGIFVGRVCITVVGLVQSSFLCPWGQGFIVYHFTVLSVLLRFGGCLVFSATLIIPYYYYYFISSFCYLLLLLLLLLLCEIYKK